MTSNRPPRYRLISTNKKPCNNDQPQVYESPRTNSKRRNCKPDKLETSDQAAYYSRKKFDEKRDSCCGCDKCCSNGKYVLIDIKRKPHTKNCSTPNQTSRCDKEQQCSDRRPQTKCLHKSFQTDCTKRSCVDKCLQANCSIENPKSHKECQAFTEPEKPCTKGEVVQCELLQDYVKEECKKSTCKKKCQTENCRYIEDPEEMEIKSNCGHTFPFLSTSDGYLLIHPKMISYENENICMLAANPNEVSISHKEWCQDEMVVTRMDHTSQPYKCQKIPQEKCSNMNSFAKGNRSTFQKHRANNCCVQVDTRKHARDFHCTEERAGRGKCEDAIGKFCVPYPEKCKPSKSVACGPHRKVCFDTSDPCSRSYEKEISIDGSQVHIQVKTGARRMSSGEKNCSKRGMQSYECSGCEDDEGLYEQDEMCEGKNIRNSKAKSNARRGFECESDCREREDTSRQCLEMGYGWQTPCTETFSRARSEDCQNLHEIQKERGRGADQCRPKGYSNYSARKREATNRQCILSNIPEESEGHTDCDEVQMRREHVLPNDKNRKEDFYWKAKPEYTKSMITSSSGRPKESCSFLEGPLKASQVESKGQEASASKASQGSKMPLNIFQEDEAQEMPMPPTYAFIEDQEDISEEPPLSNKASEKNPYPKKQRRISKNSLFTILDTSEDDDDSHQIFSRESLASYGPTQIAAIVTIQRYIRGFLARRKLDMQEEAAIKIQRAFRDHAARLAKKKSDRDFSSSQGRNAVKRTHSSDDTGSSMEDLPNLMKNLDTPKGAVLLFGGLDPAIPFNSSNNTGREVYLYMVDGNLWMHVGRMPEPRSHFGIARMNNDVYIVGGTDPRYRTPSERNLVVPSVWKVSLRHGLWVTDPDLPMDLPNPRSHFGCVSKDGFMYAIGGNDVNFRALESCLKYDSLLNIWTPIADLDAPRVSMGITVFQDRIWVAGGLSKNVDTPVYRSVLNYDTLTDSWTKVENLPLPRAFCSLVVATDRYTRLYVVGGAGPRDRYSQRNKSSSEILTYNSEIPEWKLAGVLLNPRHGHAAAAIEDQIVILGGVISTHQSATKTVDIFDIPSSHCKEGRKLHQRLSGMGAISLL